MFVVVVFLLFYPYIKKSFVYNLGHCFLVVVVLHSFSGQWEGADTGGRVTVGGGVGEGRLRWPLQFQPFSQFPIQCTKIFSNFIFACEYLITGSILKFQLFFVFFSRFF